MVIWRCVRTIWYGETSVWLSIWYGEFGLDLPMRSACIVWKKGEELAMSFRFGEGFRASTTSLIRGLAFG